MNTEKENLKGLLEPFFDANAADQMAKDIQEGDELLARFKTPGPDEQVIGVVKDRIAAELARRRSRTRLRRTITAASVAAILLAGIVFLQISPRTSVPGAVGSKSPSMVFAESDAENVLFAELDDIEETLVQVRTGSWDTYQDSDVDDLENELNEIAGNFWKG